LKLRIALNAIWSGKINGSFQYFPSLKGRTNTTIYADRLLAAWTYWGLPM
jgi:hypothetical protein